MSELPARPPEQLEDPDWSAEPASDTDFPDFDPDIDLLTYFD